MATSPLSMTVPPPPGGPMPTPPKAGAEASPAPPQLAPKVDAALKLALQAVQALRQVQQDFPAAAAPISRINDLIREVQLKIMAGSKPTEPAAPPVPSA